MLLPSMRFHIHSVAFRLMHVRCCCRCR